MNFSKAHFLNELNKSKEAINESLNESVNTSEVNEAKSMPYAKARKLTKKLNDDKLLQNLLAITDKIHDKMGTNDEVNDWLYQIITYGNKHPQMWMDESVNLNEAAMIKLTVEPPYTLKQEKHFANKVKLIEKPIKFKWYI